MPRSDWRLMWRELRARFRFCLLFSATLSLGLIGFIVVDAMKSAVSDSVSQKSKDYLTADLSVSARRRLNESEERLVKEVMGSTPSVDVIDVYTMAATDQDSRLVQVRAVGQGFPFYGEIRLRGRGLVRAAQFGELIKSGKVWAGEELLAQLQVNVGQTLQLGNAQFEIEDVIVEDTGQSVGFGGLAPRVYMGDVALEKAGIFFEMGTTANVNRLYRVKNDDDLAPLVARLQERLEDPGIRVYTHQSAGEQTARFLSYLTDYLSLVSLVALVLSLVGVSFLFRVFLRSKVRDMAILLSIGFPSERVRRVLLWQVAILGAAAAVPAVLVSLLILPLLSKVLVEVTPFALAPGVTGFQIITAFLVAVFASLLMAWPLVHQFSMTRPAALFQDGGETGFRFQPRGLWRYLPMILFFVGFSLFLARSVRVGGLFAGVFLAAGLLLLGVGWLWMRLWRRAQNADLVWRLGLRSLVRSAWSTQTCFLALSISVLLILFLQGVRTSLSSELEGPRSESLPSFFVLDIQDEQVKPLEDFLAARGQKLSLLSPFIRGRLDRVNDVAFEKKAVSDAYVTREAQEEAQFRNRGFNLTYRETLFDSEIIVKGEEWQGHFEDIEGAVPLVTVEKRFADRLGLKIGDLLQFDIQGVDITARVASLRKVRWTSFQPNFFIQFQTGVLEEAPKTFIAVIPKSEGEAIAKLQNDLVRQFPNISMINVQAAVQRIVSVVDQMNMALQLMALLSGACGLFVLFSIARHQALTRQKEINLYKVLGAEPRLLSRVVGLEFGVLGLSAALSGALLSQVMVAVFSYFVFDRLWTAAPLMPLAGVAVVLSLSALIGFLASREVIGARPVLYLQS